MLPVSLRSRSPLLIPLGLALLVASPAPVPAAMIVDPDHGPVRVMSDPPQDLELSGIAYAGGSQFYAVSDQGGMLFPLDVTIDPTSGAILGVEVGSGTVLAQGVDLEGIVYDAASGSVLVADESGPALREHALSDGALLDEIALPAIFSAARSNLSLESLTLDSAGGLLWTANEEALTVDGEPSGFATGTTVRLQRFDASREPAGQWAYTTDPIPGGPALGLERSGVADLLALPGGELLVLERSFSSVFFRTRIYQVDFAGATDTSELGNLASDPHIPVGKILLWELGGEGSLRANYEGLALGPALDAQDWSLLLIADDGGGADRFLYPLRITFAPEPTGGRGRAAALASLAMLFGIRNILRGPIRRGFGGSGSGPGAKR